MSENTNTTIILPPPHLILDLHYKWASAVTAIEGALFLLTKNPLDRIGNRVLDVGERMLNELPPNTRDNIPSAVWMSFFGGVWCVMGIRKGTGRIIFSTGPEPAVAWENFCQLTLAGTAASRIIATV